MNRTIRFILPIPPQSVQQGARYGGGRFYNDRKKEAFRVSVKKEIAHMMPEKMIFGPIEADFKFVHDRPKTVDVGPADQEVPCWGYGHGPDTDNLIKSLKDALAKANLFSNDKQIWRYREASQVYCSEYTFPRIEITLYYDDAYTDATKESKPKPRPKKAKANTKASSSSPQGVVQGVLFEDSAGLGGKKPIRIQKHWRR